MPQAYYYSSVAGQFTLTTAATGGATILNVNTTTGMPGSTPFKLVLEPGTVREEIVKVTSIGGLALTVVRGWDGSPATSHDAGTPIRHAVTAEDHSLSRQHEAATSGVHGVTSGLVGVSDTQTLTNKTLSPNAASAVAGVAKGLSGQSGDLIQGQDYLGNPVFRVDPAGNVTAPNLTSKFATYDANVASVNSHLAGTSGVHGVTGSVVGTTDSQTLTNKTISGGSNTLSAIPQSAVTGLTSAVNRLPQAIAAGTFSSVPNNSNWGVGNSWTITEGGSLVTGGIDTLTFAASGLVTLTVNLYIPAAVGVARYGWILKGGSQIAGIIDNGGRDNFSFSWTGRVASGDVLTFQQRQQSGGTISTTVLITGIFFAN